MQINTLDNAQELAEFLGQSKILDVTDHGIARSYTGTYDDQGLLVFADSDGKATVVYPAESFDDKSGGRVHDHARGIKDHGQV